MSILTLEDSVAFVRENGKALYPDPTRKTLGNIPADLHAELMAYAEERGLKIYEVIGGLWDFMEQYEATYEKELKEQRNSRR